MEWIDLRSDTVTQPTPEMREAMARARLGDDVYGEDPTVNQLQSMAAEMLGKEQAIFVPSGTMGNLASILAHCNRGDEVILGDRSHTFINEGGGIAVFGGVHPRVIPNQADGTLQLETIKSAIRADNPHYPVSRLISLENTHNLCGGASLTVEYTHAVGDLARRHGLKLHLDGARIFNAAAALGVSARELAEPADSITFCLSKGLCAPVGSLICGSQEFIRRAHRMRKVLGGGMRQVGVLAAAGIVALETIVPLLPTDHERTKRLARELSDIPGVLMDHKVPPTNMIYLNITPDAQMNAVRLSQELEKDGIKIDPSTERRIRLVIHHWIDDRAIDKVVMGFRRLLGSD